MRWFLAFMLLSEPVLAQSRTIYGSDGSPLMKQTIVGQRLVDRKMDGTPLGYWIREGSYLCHRSMGGSLLERVLVK